MNSTSKLSNDIRSLRATVENLVTPRHVSGTFNLETGNDAGLFYRNSDGSRTGWINFASAEGVKDHELEGLVAVCEEATFGLGKKDVLDPSYRKAWKLDPSRFSLQFDLARSGILETVRSTLLHYGESSLALEAHLDKLNVYGPGSFFKSHVDTPRDKSMVATLVIVLPTKHEGGDLLLMNKCWTFDSANLVSNAAAQEPRVAFVAFYSDIEHEVTLVESGYRVSVTFNLYCAKPLSPATPKVSLSITPEEKSVREALRWILENEEVLPDGGVVAFGLTHQYPIDIQDIKVLDTTFSGLLKGGDALLERACQSLNLRLKVQALYTTSENEDPTVNPRYEENFRYLTNSTSINAPSMESEDSHFYLKEALEDAGYAAKNFSYSHKKSTRKPVLWLTRPLGLMKTTQAWIAYGNQAELDFIYGQLVLTAEVPACGKRKAVFDGTLDVDDADSGSDSSETDNDY